MQLMHIPGRRGQQHSVLFDVDELEFNRYELGGGYPTRGTVTFALTKNDVTNRWTEVLTQDNRVLRWALSGTSPHRSRLHSVFVADYGVAGGTLRYEAVASAVDDELFALEVMHEAEARAAWRRPQLFWMDSNESIGALGFVHSWGYRTWPTVYSLKREPWSTQRSVSLRGSSRSWGIERVCHGLGQVVRRADTQRRLVKLLDGDQLRRGLETIGYPQLYEVQS